MASRRVGRCPFAKKVHLNNGLIPEFKGSHVEARYLIVRAIDRRIISRFIGDGQQLRSFLECLFLLVQ